MAGVDARRINQMYPSIIDVAVNFTYDRVYDFGKLVNGVASIGNRILPAQAWGKAILETSRLTGIFCWVWMVLDGREIFKSDKTVQQRVAAGVAFISDAADALIWCNIASIVSGVSLSCITMIDFAGCAVAFAARTVISYNEYCHAEAGLARQEKWWETVKNAGICATGIILTLGQFAIGYSMVLPLALTAITCSVAAFNNYYYTNTIAMRNVAELVARRNVGQILPPGVLHPNAAPVVAL